MIKMNKTIRTSSRITLKIGLFLFLLLASCSTEGQFPDSPDGRYRAKEVGAGADIHYQVVEIKTGRVILTTNAQYDTANDVKAGGFSSDSKKFAAVYHYGHAGNYSWIGVWSTETGKFLYSKEKSGWTTSLAGVFNEDSARLPATPTATKATPTPAPTTIVSTTEFMKGVAYTSWQRGEYSSQQSDTTLSQVIKPMGVNWITLLVTCYQEKITSTEIQCKANSSTPADDLTHIIQYAHSLGIRVMLKPHIDLTNDPNHWRGQIAFGDDEVAWEKWFDSYRNFITHYADIAQKTGTDYFAVGTELSGTSHRAEQWQAVVKAVRAIYSGPLIYAANWGEEDRITWWDKVNAIGVDAYYPLTRSNQPTVADLKAAWAPIVSRLGQLSKKWNRPIVFTEIGYRSLDGANREPYNYQISGGLDLQEQADCYQAVFDTFTGQDWWRGVFWWNWTTNPAQGGLSDTNYTANNKPAENILRTHYGAPLRSISIPTIITPTPSQERWILTSPNGLYGAVLVDNDAGTHYQVVEIKTGRIVLTTRAQYDTANDVKAGGFSSDSKKFAAVYHYGHAGNYSWIGVWSTETGEFLYSKIKSGWTTSLDGVFE